MDDVDHMLIREEKLHAAQIAARKPEGPQATGACLSCEEPLAAPRRWCDADCRDDFEKLSHTNLHR